MYRLTVKVGEDLDKELELTFKGKKIALDVKGQFVKAGYKPKLELVKVIE